MTIGDTVAMLAQIVGRQKGPCGPEVTVLLGKRRDGSMIEVSVPEHWLRAA